MSITISLGSAIGALLVGVAVYLAYVFGTLLMFSHDRAHIYRPLLVVAAAGLTSLGWHALGWWN